VSRACLHKSPTLLTLMVLTAIFAIEVMWLVKC
jgi:hypothetical protein